MSAISVEVRTLHVLLFYTTQLSHHNIIKIHKQVSWPADQISTDRKHAEDLIECKLAGCRIVLGWLFLEFWALVDKPYLPGLHNSDWQFSVPTFLFVVV